MADGIIPVDSEAFRRIKVIFKQNSDIIVTTNRTCNYVVSDILIVLIFNICKDIFAFGMSLTVLDTHLQISTPELNDDGNEHTNPVTFMIISAFFDALTIGAKSFVLVTTFGRVTATNRQMFATQNNLHELASLYIDRPTEIYQSVRIYSLSIYLNMLCFFIFNLFFYLFVYFFDFFIYLFIFLLIFFPVFSIFVFLFHIFPL